VFCCTLALFYFLLYKKGKWGYREEDDMERGQPSYRIKDLNHNERPRERLASMGAQVLSTAELLAILLRVGVEGENAMVQQRRLKSKQLLTWEGVCLLRQTKIDQSFTVQKMPPIWSNMR